VHGLTIMSNLFALESIGGGKYIRANNAKFNGFSKYIQPYYYIHSTFELSGHKFSKLRISKLLPMLNIKLYHSV
jgi:hypothetical protein